MSLMKSKQTLSRNAGISPHENDNLKYSELSDHAKAVALLEFRKHVKPSKVQSASDHFKLNDYRFNIDGDCTSCRDQVIYKNSSEAVAGTSAGTSAGMFKYEQLSRRAQEKALRDYASSQDSYDPEWQAENLIEDLEKFGIEVDKKDISYSVSFSQGDFASFSTESIDVKKYLTATKQKTKYQLLLGFVKREPDGFEFSVRVKKEGRHGSSMNLDSEIKPHLYEGEIWPRHFLTESHVSKTVAIKLVNQMEDLAEEMLQFCRNKAHDLYKSISDDILYQTSEEAATSYWNDFEVRFDEDGNVV